MEDVRDNAVNIITMGCSKNLVDSERLIKMFETRGFRVKHNPEVLDRGSIVIVNTCGFIGDAKEESINMILELVELKKKRRIKKLYVMGCLSQRYASDLPKEIKGVNGWYGKFDWNQILDDLMPDCYCYGKAIQPWARTVTTGSHAYIKISEGCNRFCAFCAIPIITGRMTSRPIEEIVSEVTDLVKKGITEFNVIAQDLSSYGMDLYGEKRLAELIDRMAQVDGVKWIRLHYAYPTDFPYDVLPVMAKHPNVCKYLDIALQHISDKVLKNMNRHITGEETRQLLARIRKEVPGIAIRTTLMVGFPGEGEKEFEELKEFVREQRFERMGAFAYSEEEGTYAANHLKDDVPEEVKQSRLDELMEIQYEISEENNNKFVGKEVIGVYEGLSEDRLYYRFRTEADSPEVDQEVLVELTFDPSKLDPNKRIPGCGRFYRLPIVEAWPYELIAETYYEID